MSRLIDADKLEEILDVNIQILHEQIKDARTEVQKIVHEAQLFSTMEMIRVIREQPTAFDVDKVVEQLEKQVYEIDDSLSLSARDVIDEEDVFEIVKAGGIDENM